MERLLIDLGEGDKCSDLTLVALSRVSTLKHLLLKPLIFERLRNVNTSYGLVDIKNDLSTLEQKAFDKRLKHPTVFKD